tara:strand:- start:486 stop:950 length:465 start_codon:yes stop_codon:yes gene_type:complete
MDEFSIADFAESLISEEIDTKGKEKAFSAPNKGVPNERDVSEVQISDSYRQQLVESYLGKSSSPEIPTENIFGNVNEEEPYDTEVDQEEIVNKLQNLIHELKEVLTEMSIGTGTGAVGGHMGGTAKKTKHDCDLVHPGKSHASWARPKRGRRRK